MMERLHMLCIYRLIDISGSDDTYESSIQAPYPESAMNTTSLGYDPLLEEEVELINYYPTPTVQPEQGIVPMAGWLELGVEQ